MNQSKFEEEKEIAARFLLLLGHSNFSLHDPNAGQQSDSGADVLAVVDSRRYGIQVTVLHPDEGQSSNEKGSDQRRREAQFKESTQPYAMWGTPNPMAGLKYRIEQKRKKTYLQANFDEVILLIVSGLPQMGAVTSTLLFEPFLDLGKMNAELSPILEGSR